MSLTYSCIGCSIGGIFRQSDFALSKFLGVGICIGGVRGGGNLGIIFCLIYSGSVWYCDKYMLRYVSISYSLLCYTVVCCFGL